MGQKFPTWRKAAFQPLSLKVVQTPKVNRILKETIIRVWRATAGFVQYSYSFVHCTYVVSHTPSNNIKPQNFAAPNFWISSPFTSASLISDFFDVLWSALCFFLHHRFDLIFVFFCTSPYDTSWAWVTLFHVCRHCTLTSAPLCFLTLYTCHYFLIVFYAFAHFFVRAHQQLHNNGLFSVSIRRPVTSTQHLVATGRVRRDGEIVPSWALTPPLDSQLQCSALGNTSGWRCYSL